MKKYLYLGALFIAFFAGAAIWNVVGTVRSINGSSRSMLNYRSYSPQGVIVRIENQEVTSEDLNFEFDLLTHGVFSSEKLSSESANKENIVTELNPLREKIIDSIVERKLLFQFVKQDKNFDLDDPSRYVVCLNEWMELLKSDQDIFKSTLNQERLKNWLCEKDILKQYVDEKVYSAIAVSEEQIADFYSKNEDKLIQPELAEIRQIVFSGERQARKIRSRLSRRNFSELAREFSITPEAENGGKLPVFAKGEMPPFFDIVFDMKIGQISDILKSTYGFHIIVLDKKVPQKRLTIEESKAMIIQKLLKSSREAEYKKWVDLAIHSIQVSTPRLKL